MKKRKRQEPDPLALDPFKIDLEPFKIELPAFEIAPLEPLALGDLKLDLPELKLDPLPELDLKPLRVDLLEPLPGLDLDARKLPDPLADAPRKARKGGNRHRRTP